MWRFAADNRVNCASRGAGLECADIQLDLVGSFYMFGRTMVALMCVFFVSSTLSMAQSAKREAYRGEAADRAIAAAYAPVFAQGLGDSPRFDYITNFDFDGDWKGDNNWNNAADVKRPLLAYVYFSVSETATHYFIHYALFHPRDYKGGSTKGRLLSGLIREGAAVGGKYDPTGLSGEAVLAHENDLEGCLVVVEKGKGAPESGRVVFVETLAHNRFLKYAPAGSSVKDVAAVPIRNNRVKLFVEPKGHGIEAFTGSAVQKKDSKGGVLNYRYMGRADDPAKAVKGPVGYDLVPIQTTLWDRAVAKSAETYGETATYGSVADGSAFASSLARSNGNAGGSSSSIVLGSAFNGKVGAPNMARPPWGWFDSREKDRPLGEWYFDPAGTVKRHFGLPASFGVSYVHNPALGVHR